MVADLTVRIGKLKFNNPVTVASGTFGYGEEFADFIDLRKLGAIITKTITLRPRRGNPMPRTCETPAGMLNSIGLENPGIDVFIKDKLPLLKKIGMPVIVSIASEDDTDEFITLARHLDELKEVSAIELNISCPNIHRVKRAGYGVEEKKCQLIAQDTKATYELVKAVRKATKKTLITKLSPNVTDITEIALAAESAGTEAVSLVNTFYGMSIDVNTRKPNLAQIVGGLSGPAIRPLALRMIWEVYKKVKIPIIGMGGIMDLNSALEFFMAGATVISIGTANFINPKTSIEIINGLNQYFIKNKIENITQFIGCIKT